MRVFVSAGDHQFIAEIVNADHPGEAEFVKMEGWTIF